LDELDKAVYNMNKGEIAIFAGPSGSGKSVTLQNLAINLAFNGLNVVFITMELNQEFSAMRMDMMVTGIPSSDLFKQMDDVELRVKAAQKKSGIIRIKALPETGTCTLDIRAYLKEYELHTKVKPDVVIVDHMDNMTPNNKKI